MALKKTGPFKRLVHGGIWLASHYQAHCISTSKVGETELTGGRALGFGILLDNTGPSFLRLGQGEKCQGRIEPTNQKSMLLKHQ